MRTKLMIAQGMMLLLISAVQGQESAESIERIQAYYFGNSLTGNTMPGMHPLLGESVGKRWTVQASIQAWAPIHAHMRQVMQRGGQYDRFVRVAPECDALVMLLFAGTGLSFTTTEIWGQELPQPTDLGDVAACSYLIDEFLKHSPQGRCLIYSPWPGIPAVRDLTSQVRDELKKELREQGLSREEIEQRLRERKLTHEEMEPLRRSFDYAAHWLTEDYVPAATDAEQRARFRAYADALRAKGNPPATVVALAAATSIAAEVVRADLGSLRMDEAALSPAETAAGRLAQFGARSGWPHTHSRAHHGAVMEQLKTKHPDLWRQGRLGIVPVGDVFLELDRNMRAGEVPGLVNVGEFLADGIHLRAGLPRYVLAATHYAALFREHPGRLDWKLYQDADNYASGKFGFYVHQPDLGVLIDITPERAQVVNDTIWEVTSQHPHTPWRQ